MTISSTEITKYWSSNSTVDVPKPPRAQSTPVTYGWVEEDDELDESANQPIPDQLQLPLIQSPRLTPNPTPGSSSNYVPGQAIFRNLNFDDLQSERDILDDWSDLDVGFRKIHPNLPCEFPELVAAIEAIELDADAHRDVELIKGLLEKSAEAIKKDESNRLEADRRIRERVDEKDALWSHESAVPLEAIKAIQSKLQVVENQCSRKLKETYQAAARSVEVELNYTTAVLTFLSQYQRGGADDLQDLDADADFDDVDEDAKIDAIQQADELIARASEFGCRTLASRRLRRFSEYIKASTRRDDQQEAVCRDMVFCIANVVGGVWHSLSDAEKEDFEIHLLIELWNRFPASEQELLRRTWESVAASRSAEYGHVSPLVTLCQRRAGSAKSAASTAIEEESISGRLRSLTELVTETRTRNFMAKKTTSVVGTLLGTQCGQIGSAARQAFIRQAVAEAAAMNAAETAPMLQRTNLENLLSGIFVCLEGHGRRASGRSLFQVSTFVQLVKLGLLCVEQALTAPQGAVRHYDLIEGLGGLVKVSGSLAHCQSQFEQVRNTHVN